MPLYSYALSVMCSLHILLDLFAIWGIFYICMDKLLQYNGHESQNKQSTVYFFSSLLVVSTTFSSVKTMALTQSQMVQLFTVVVDSLPTLKIERSFCYLEPALPCRFLWPVSSHLPTHSNPFKW